jgi:hypothetical protein
MAESMSDDQIFRLEEYRALRKEIELYLTESRSQERYTLIAVGVIWGWLITNHLTHGLLWFVPIALTLATSLRMAAILKHFGIIRGYIMQLEDKFGVNGWDHREKSWTLGLAFIVVDVALFVLAAVAFYYRCKLAQSPCPVTTTCTVLSCCTGVPKPI